jgi:hypothetical protein
MHMQTSQEENKSSESEDEAELAFFGNWSR